MARMSKDMKDTLVALAQYRLALGQDVRLLPLPVCPWQYAKKGRPTEHAILDCTGCTEFCIFFAASGLGITIYPCLLDPASLLNKFIRAVSDEFAVGELIDTVDGEPVGSFKILNDIGYLFAYGE